MLDQRGNTDPLSERIFSLKWVWLSGRAQPKRRSKRWPGSGSYQTAEESPVTAGETDQASRMARAVSGHRGRVAVFLETQCETPSVSLRPVVACLCSGIVKTTREPKAQGHVRIAAHTHTPIV